MKLTGKTLVLGGTRSGKSTYAENLIEKSRLSAVYIATATAGDDEMTARIDAHKARRNKLWHTIEEPIDLPGAITRAVEIANVVLVDCMTLWLSNLMGGGHDVEAKTTELMEVLHRQPGPIIIVSNEVGLGIVSDNQLARQFTDAQGILNQKLAQEVNNVILMAAGLPLTLKGRPFDEPPD